MFGLVLIDGVVLVVADADLSAEEEIRDEANEIGRNFLVKGIIICADKTYSCEKLFMLNKVIDVIKDELREYNERFEQMFMKTKVG